MPLKYNPKNIRNFSIIAHIDHGKSTVSDRLLEITHTVEERKMQKQLLDDMDIERERGITIKAHPVTMIAEVEEEKYVMNFIDTPGHVDFSYEVSRSLAACDGAILIVDAVQGVQAQTLANMHLALARGLEILCVINKIDLPAADPERVKKQIRETLGLHATHALLLSAKTGQGISTILDEIVYSLPAPNVDQSDTTLRALIFDSHYDAYRGVMIYIRVISGSITKKTPIFMMAAKRKFEVVEVGIFTPGETPVDELRAGEVGYLVANIKNPKDVLIGDTV